MTTSPIRVDTVVVGAGQCGLSVGYYLAKAGASFVILDEHDRVGDGWRRRYDSLVLYTPTRYDNLPGLAFPKIEGRFPTAIELADYLEGYAAHFDLPVVNGAHVEHATTDAEGRFTVRAGGRTYESDNLVVATGSQQVPHVPGFAGQLDPRIRQFHSDDYRNPGQLTDGSVLIVGACHSGADLAMECAATGRHTWLVGPDRGQMPMKLEGGVARAVSPVLWFVASHVMTLRTPVGRKMQDEVRNTGGPLLRYRRGDLEEAGVERHENKVTEVIEGKPVLDDGTRLDPSNVIWCTGYSRDFTWLNVPYVTEDGWPKQERGVVSEVPGLYFVGLMFQFAFTSMLVGGAKRDAEHVAKHLLRSGRPSLSTSTAA